ncbi:MAG TPA: bifunctional 2-polyprenyl-6-hydroxyphenol methylase/3-demethylubiquinol 3-O-methyltransferase UbiG [Gammaproteobacteria bacterium]|nr:bifunctional 2-polyprenyl-6-hydroxyphenol methylase/3-demethylubiquinol 3-O-methyltransferase UbiG [Gammaproteobacteria bacterium]
MTGTNNIDPAEVAKFDASATRWWDPEGEYKPLHEINPLRLRYIQQRVDLAGRRVADIGCGGGILAEGLARAGARVTAVDMAGGALAVARLHALESGVEVDYRQMTGEALAQQEGGTFDAVTCMELLEHVPDPASLIAACAALVKPGGDVLLSTLNRNPKAYLHAIIGAEYLLKLLPKGTHDYAKFIRPAELARWLRAAGLELDDLTGLHYNPLTRRYRLGGDIDVNYLAHAQKPL